MAKRANSGRKSLFGATMGGPYVQGLLSPEGYRCFEAARLRLGRLLKTAPEKLSQAAVIEYLARGHRNTVAYVTSVRAHARS